MKLKHTALYAKGWYKKTNLVEDVKKTLHADGYIPDTKADVISILAREVFPIVEKRLGGDAILDILSGIHPNKYDMCYDFVVIHYFLNKMTYMERSEFDVEDWEPDYNVLPKKEDE